MYEDKVTKDKQSKVSRYILFIDDIVLVAESLKQVN